jgi:hypothetical protein
MHVHAFGSRGRGCLRGETEQGHIARVTLQKLPIV